MNQDLKAAIQYVAKDSYFAERGDSVLARQIFTGHIAIGDVSHAELTYYSVLNVVRRARKSNRYAADRAVPSL